MDTWAWKINDGAASDTVGQEIIITIEVNNPPLVWDLLEDWMFSIKTTAGTTGDADTFPRDFARYDTATLPPLSSGLVTLTYGTTTNA